MGVLRGRNDVGLYMVHGMINAQASQAALCVTSQYGARTIA
jgi:hypothetical protein